MALKPLFLATLAMVALSWYLKGRFLDHSKLEQELLAEPLQDETEREPFSFEYKGQLIHVRPVASYKLWGLVVSHNNIHSMADLVHDSTSVDTKDLCTIWGPNLESNDFQLVDYKSGQFTCYFSYPSGATFHHRALGNNHLITDNQTIRNQLEWVRVGDQVRLNGLLVDYQMEDWQSFWRKSSTTRSDTQCEVVFLEELEVLRRATPGWYAAFAWGKRLLLLIPVLYVFVFWLEARNPATSRVGEI